MALIKCKECGKDISDSSSECIHCGAPTAFSLKESNSIGINPKKRITRKTVIIVICLFMLCFVILAIPLFANFRHKNVISSRTLNGEYSSPDPKDNTTRVTFKFKEDGTTDYQICNIKTDDCTIESYTYRKYESDITIFYSDDVLIYNCSLEDSDKILRCYDRNDQHQDYARTN